MPLQLVMRTLKQRSRTKDAGKRKGNEWWYNNNGSNNVLISCIIKPTNYRGDNTVVWI